MSQYDGRLITAIVGQTILGALMWRRLLSGLAAKRVGVLVPLKILIYSHLVGAILALIPLFGHWRLGAFEPDSLVFEPQSIGRNPIAFYLLIVEPLSIGVGVWFTTRLNPQSR